MGVALLQAIPATAVPTAQLSIFLAGSADWLGTRATLRVSDLDTTRRIAPGLRQSELHLARMLELTRFWCQDRRPEFTVNWNYEADGGKLFLGEYSISCQFAERMFQDLGPGPSERRTITQWRKDRREFVQTLNLEATGKVEQFLSLIKGLKPHCTATLLCPGDRLNLVSRTPISSSSVACTNTLTAAKTKLEQMQGVSVARMQSTSIAQLYANFPAKRPMRYIFQLAGQGTAQVVRSPSILKQVSQDIMTKCESVSSVTFSVVRSEELRIFGLVRSNVVEEFKCIQSEPSEKLNWGYVVCL
jgi:hypothetical protein